MPLKLYNTLSRKIEEFKPLKPPKVGIYICGPTVYDYTHIGHMRTYTNADVLVRSLRFLGYQPLAVMNITDVGHLTGDRDMGEDKMEKAARGKKKTIWQIAKFYTDYFWRAMAGVNVSKPNVVCKATDYIKEMMELVKKIEDKGFSYKTSDGVYFDTSKFKGYGKLANLDIEGLKEGARVEKNPEKKSPTDFALWKFSPQKGPKRQMEWNSPWGKGFPGWHIECSSMSMKHLGETFDIHTGGIEHIPVHHTNEIAQSEVVTGKPFVKYWFHSEHLLVEGQKMSKSLGNFYTLDDVKKKGFDPLALRYLFLTAHYRTEMNFTWKALKGTGVALNKLQEQAGQWGKAKIGCAEFEKRFLEAINDDLNLPQALAVVWDLVKSDYPNSAKKASLLKFDKVLGLNLGVQKKLKLKIPEEIKKLVDQREKLRKQQKWPEADKIRREIEKKGFLIEDTKKGTKIKVKKNDGRKNTRLVLRA